MSEESLNVHDRVLLQVWKIKVTIPRLNCLCMRFVVVVVVVVVVLMKELSLRMESSV